MSGNAKGFYLKYKSPEGETGTSRTYLDKEEMWDNYEFLTRSGYTVSVKCVQ